MRHKLSLYLLQAFMLLLCTSPTAHAQDSLDVCDSTPPAIFNIPLCDTTVTFHWHRPVDKGLMFLVIHDDENTSSQVAWDALYRYDASLLEMKNNDKYLFNLLTDSLSFLFNPNRIFSLNGIESILSRFGPCTDSVVQEIDRFARQVAGAFFYNPGCIIALHNNGNKGFSIESYVTDTLLAKVVDSLYINPLKDPDDFFYVNDAGHFTFLKTKGYNTVLQSKGTFEDDGSLSIWCQRNGIPYINIETEQVRYAEQKKMLDDIIQLFIQP